MNDIIIKAENISKKYCIRRQKEKERYKTLRDIIASGSFVFLQKAINLLSCNTTHYRTEQEEFFAVNKLNFEIRLGEVVGVIGRNGAGKSTLLKILSRITEPSEGRLTIKGRITSLLEVGTGFHPELTGRENIFLNGAILGMSRKEIRRKFDEIVAFSEVEKFLDTPVKRYSSGMYVRLAFAVAANLDPEILLVDEVLAVGDAVFQKKCIGKMEGVAQEGRTVLFVSHNMGAISNLTDRCLLLNAGELIADDLTSKVVSEYIALSSIQKNTWETQEKNTNPIQIIQGRLLNNFGHPSTEFDVKIGFIVELEYQVRKVLKSAVIAINIHAADGAHILSLEDTDGNEKLLLERVPGLFRTKVHIPGYWLNSGIYFLRISCGIPGIKSFQNIEALTFHLVETGDTTTRGHRKGYLLPMLRWKTEKV